MGKISSWVNITICRSHTNIKKCKNSAHVCAGVAKMKRRRKSQKPNWLVRQEKHQQHCPSWRYWLLFCETSLPPPTPPTITRSKKSRLCYSITMIKYETAITTVHVYNCIITYATKIFLLMLLLLYQLLM